MDVGDKQDDICPKSNAILRLVVCHQVPLKPRSRNGKSDERLQTFSVDF